MPCPQSWLRSPNAAYCARIVTPSIRIPCRGGANRTHVRLGEVVRTHVRTTHPAICHVVITLRFNIKMPWNLYPSRYFVYINDITFGSKNALEFADPPAVLNAISYDEHKNSPEYAGRPAISHLSSYDAR